MIFSFGVSFMRAIVTVTGKDRKGIIAEVCSFLAQQNCNILDINQTVMQEFFTMTMLIDTAECIVPFDELSSILSENGRRSALSIRVQREDIFNAMYEI